MSLAGSAPVGADMLLFLPYLNGGRLGARTNARAQFIGLTSGHGAGHLHRAVMEGVAAAAARLVRFGGEVQPNPAWSDTYARLAPVFKHAYQNSGTYWTMLEAAEAATARTS